MNVDRLLLDNFTPPRIAEVVKRLGLGKKTARARGEERRARGGWRRAWRRPRDRGLGRGPARERARVRDPRGVLHLDRRAHPFRARARSVAAPGRAPVTGPGRYLGVPTEFVRTIGSTNDEVLRRAMQGAPEGLVIATDEQTAGRGRHGRSWWDAPGRSLLFSVLLRPGLPLARFPLLGMAMACAVVEAGGVATGQELRGQVAERRGAPGAEALRGPRRVASRRVGARAGGRRRDQREPGGGGVSARAARSRDVAAVRGRRARPRPRGGPDGRARVLRALSRARGHRGRRKRSARRSCRACRSPGRG